MTEVRTGAVVAAAGSGSRMGQTVAKQFLPLAGMPMLVHTIRVLLAVSEIHDIVIVAPVKEHDRTHALIEQYHLTPVAGTIRVVAGGRLRQDSVLAGLEALPAETDLVLVHDGARPLVPVALVRACLQAARQSGAAIAALPVSDTVKEADAAGRVVATLDRNTLWLAQTPQVASMSLLRQAFALAATDSLIATDEAALLEHLGHPVTLVPGSECNIKITRPEDLALAEALIMQTSEAPITSSLPRIRIGHGYDAHRLVPDRPLVLGGEVIPHSRGLLGHSDADVLTHALCDAILGACGCGDLGSHFPDTDERYRNIRSLELLEQVVQLATDRGYCLNNADITVVAEQPKLAPYMGRMRDNLARICRQASGAVNLKATTTETMGFEGRQEGISAYAVVVLRQQEDGLDVCSSDDNLL